MTIHIVANAWSTRLTILLQALWLSLRLPARLSGHGSLELVIVAMGTATGCVGVQKAVPPKPGPVIAITAGSGDALPVLLLSAAARRLPVGQVDDPPTFCSLACEVYAYAGQLSREFGCTRSFGGRHPRRAIGLASDALEE